MSGSGVRRLRGLAGRFLPPIVGDLFRSRGEPPKHGFHGRYDDFSSALDAAGGLGYASPELIGATVAGTRRTREIVEAGPRRTQSLWVMQNLAAILYAIGGRSRSSLRVLDFGGGTGVHYFTLRHLLPVKEIRWTICETRNTANAGREYFANEELVFVDNINDVEAPVDLVFTSGALHYTENPLKYFRRFLALSNVVIVAWTPFVSGDEDVLTLQSVTSESYSIRLPVWLFGEKLWESHLEQAGFAVSLRWTEQADRGSWQGQKIVYEGLVAVRSAIVDTL